LHIFFGNFLRSARSFCLCQKKFKKFPEFFFAAPLDPTSSPLSGKSRRRKSFSFAGFAPRNENIMSHPLAVAIVRMPCAEKFIRQFAVAREISLPPVGDLASLAGTLTESLSFPGYLKFIVDLKLVPNLFFALLYYLFNFLSWRTEEHLAQLRRDIGAERKQAAEEVPQKNESERPDAPSGAPRAVPVSDPRENALEDVFPKLAANMAELFPLVRLDDPEVFTGRSKQYPLSKHIVKRTLRGAALETLNASMMQALLEKAVVGEINGFLLELNVLLGFDGKEGNPPPCCARESAKQSPSDPARPDAAGLLALAQAIKLLLPVGRFSAAIATAGDDTKRESAKSAFKQSCTTFYDFVAAQKDMLA
jgi:hypothetical protein